MTTSDPTNTETMLVSDDPWEQLTRDADLSADSLPKFIAAMGAFTAWREHHNVTAISWTDGGLMVSLVADDGRTHTMRTGAWATS